MTGKKSKEEARYAEIIDLPHPDPQNHKRMPSAARAAQFAPFAALTGYGDAVSEKEELVRSAVLSDESGIPIFEDP